MTTVVRLLFVAIMLTVIGVNVWAGRQLSVFDSWPGFQANPWAVATLVDAYCAFLAFYAWVAWRERRWGARLAWFVLIMGLGSITMGLYVVLALRQVPPGQAPWATLFPLGRGRTSVPGGRAS
jgi:hypothetical protein